MTYYYNCSHKECAWYTKDRGCVNRPEADGKCQFYYPVEKWYRLRFTTDKDLIEHTYKALEKTPLWSDGERDCVHEIICRYTELLSLTTERTGARHE